MNANESPDSLAHAVRLALLGGVILSGCLLAVGLGAALLHGIPRPEGPPPHFAEVLRGLFRGDSRDFLYVGLLALIATPIVRVAILGLGWALERERVFAGVATAVLALLSISLWLGLG